MKIFYLLVMLSLVPFSVFGLSDFAGQGKAPITWDELMKPKIEPSRYFAVPGRTGDGVHPEGGYTKPVNISDKKEPVITPDVPKPQPKPDIKPCPKPEPEPKPKPDVKPCPKPEPKPQPKPDVKPCPKPEPKPCPKPDVKPDVHDKKKCTPHVKPDCKKDHAKPSCDKPSNHAGSNNKPSDHSCKPAHTMGHMGRGICGQHNGRVGGFGRPGGHHGGNGGHRGKR